MRIGDFSKACGYPAETIRYFERIGLLPQPLRGAKGYRVYDQSHRKWLQFILRGRALGFSQGEVPRPSDIANLSAPSCAGVHELPGEHISGIREKMFELERLQESLQRLRSKCRDGTLHDCPVIGELMK